MAGDTKQIFSTRHKKCIWQTQRKVESIINEHIADVNHRGIEKLALAEQISKSDHMIYFSDITLKKTVIIELN